MYGADFSRFTAIHFVERLSGGPLYRYDKLFTGVVKDSHGDTKGVTLVYHCRPKGEYLEYDWQSLETDAIALGLIRPLVMQGNATLLVDLKGLCDHWLQKLAQDPCYLLDKQTKLWVRPRLEELGRRFKVSDYEIGGV